MNSIGPMNFFRTTGTTDTTDTTIWKPGLSVVRRKFIGQIQLYGNLPYNCSIQQKRQIQLIVRDRMNSIGPMKPGFHIVVSVVSVVGKKFIGQIQLYGNLPYKCSIQKKWQIQLVVRDRMNSIGPTNFFRTTDTTDTTTTTIWKPGLNFFRTTDTTNTTIWKPGFRSIEVGIADSVWFCCSITPLRFN